MTKLQQWLEGACTELGLKIEIDPKLRLASGKTIVALARIPNLGAKNGMLIVESYDDISNITKDLADAEYGYSVLAEPTLSEEFDLDSYIEMFSDWGWAGDISGRPTWLWR